MITEQGAAGSVVRAGSLVTATDRQLSQRVPDHRIA